MDSTKKPILWAGVLIIKDRRILTLKEKDKDFYIMPGGKVESGETDEQAADREVLEELGVKVTLEKTFSEVTEHSKNTGQLIRFKLFEATLQAEPDIHNLPGKTVAIAYINSDYAKENLDVGNLILKLLPTLVKQNLID